MPYFRVDDNFGNHPKVLAIPRRDRLGCIGLWTLAGVWCARNLTDGQLGPHMLEEFGATKKHADHLVSTGLWMKTGDGYAFHDWLSWQGWTREEVLAKRAEEAERKRRWRETKAAKRQGASTRTDDDVPDMSQRDNPRTDNGTTPSVPASVRPESALTHPLPIHYPSPVPYGDRKDGSTREGSDTEVDAPARNALPPDGPPLCRRHVGQDPETIEPCPFCERLRKRWETERADTDRPLPLPLPPPCGQCDNRWIDTDDGLVHCPRCHPAALELAGAHR